MVFAYCVVAAHDLVRHDRAEPKCPDEPVFDRFCQGWGTQGTGRPYGLVDGDVGWFDPIVYAEGVKPLKIEA